MERKYGSSNASGFKKPRSMLGRRKRPSQGNDSKLETISETPATPSGSNSFYQEGASMCADESLPLGYNSICDDTFRTPLTYKLSNEGYRSARYSAEFSQPSSSIRKPLFSACRPNEPSNISASVQTDITIDMVSTPPHILRKRLTEASSAYSELEGELEQLREFTVLEKQVLSVEGLQELQMDNTSLRKQLNVLTLESNVLKGKIASLGDTSLSEIIEENFSLKEQLKSAKDDASSVQEKMEVLSSQNEKLTKTLMSVSNKLTDLETESEAKELKWTQREQDLTKSLQESWVMLETLGLKKNPDIEGQPSFIPINNLGFHQLQSSLSAKVDEISRLQSSITDLESLVVSNLDNKHTALKDLTTKVEHMSKYFRIWSDKVKTLESALTDKESELIGLKNQFDSVKNNTLSHIFNLQNCLNNDAFQDVIYESDLTDLQTICDKLKINELSIDKVVDKFGKKIISLCEATLSMKKDISIEKIKTLSLVTEKDSAMENLLKELYEKQQTIQDFNCEINNRDEKIMNMTQLLSETSCKLFCISEDLTKRDEIIERMAEEYKVKMDLLSTESINKDLRLMQLENKNSADDVCVKDNEFKVHELQLIVSENKEKIENLHEKLADKDQLIQHCSKCLEETQIQINNFKQSIIDRDLEINNLNDKLNNSCLEKEELNCKILNLTNDSELLKTDSSNKDEKLLFIKGELDKSNKALTDVDELIKHHEKTACEYEMKVEMLEVQSSSLKEELCSLRNDMTSRGEEVTKLETRVQELLNEKELMTSKLSSLLSRFDESDADGKSFDELYTQFEKYLSLKDLAEHYRNVIESKEEVLQKRVEKYESDRNKIDAYRADCEEKLKELERSHSEIVRKALEEISCLESANQSRISSLDCLIQDMNAQLENQTCELMSKEERLVFLSGELAKFETQRQEFFDQLYSLGSCSEQFNSTGYQDCLNHIMGKFDQFKDLIEHLRNIISSKDEKISKLTGEIENMLDSKMEEKNRILCLEKSVLILKEELENMTVDRLSGDYFIESFQRILPADDIQESEKRKTLEEILAATERIIFDWKELKGKEGVLVNQLISAEEEVKRSAKEFSLYQENISIKISEMEDIKEHLENKIQSKNDQLLNLTQELRAIRDKLSDGDTTLVDDLESKDEEINRFREEVSELHGKVELLEKDLAAQIKRSTALEEIVKKNEEELNMKSQELDHYKESMMNKMSEMEDIKEHLENKIQSKSDQLLKLTQELRDARGRLSNGDTTLVEDLECKDEEINRMNEQVCELLSKVETLENDLATQIKCCTVFKEKAQQAEDELIKSSQEFVFNKQSLELRITELEDLNEHLGNKIQSKEDRLLKIDLDLKNIRDTRCDEVNSFTHQLALKDQELETYRVRMDAKLSEMEEREKHLSNLIQSKNDQLSIISEELAALKIEKSVNNTSSIISLKDQEIETFKSSEKLLMEKIDNFEAEIISIRAEHANSLEEIVNLKSGLVSYESLFSECHEIFSGMLDSFGLLCSKDNGTSFEISLKEKSILINEHLIKLHSKIELLENDLATQIFLSTNLQKDIIKSEEEAKKNSQDFNTFKKTLEDQISELEDLREHIENKFQSKSDQLCKVTEEFRLLKNSGFGKENELSEKMVIKDKEIDDLKASQKNLSDKVLSLEEQLSEVKTQLTLKTAQCVDAKDKIIDFSCNYNNVVINRRESLSQEKDKSLERQLSDAYRELDAYKTNEVDRDSKMEQFKLDILTLNSSLSKKTKEIESHKENMDKLSENIVELMHDQDNFFFSLQQFIPFKSVKSFKDIINVIETNSAMLNSSNQNTGESKDELIKKLNERIESLSVSMQQFISLETDLNLLKKSYDTVCAQLNDYKDWESVKSETSQHLMHLLLSFGLIETDPGTTSIKDQISCISQYIHSLKDQINSLEKKLENQMNFDTANMEIIEKNNIDIFNKIESTGQVVSKLYADVSSFQLFFDERIAAKDLEIENLRKEHHLVLEDLKEILVMSEKHSLELTSVTQEFLQLKQENESLINNLIHSSESDIKIVEDLTELCNDMIAFISSSSKYNLGQFPSCEEVISLFFDKFNAVTLETFDIFSKEIANYIKTFNSEFEQYGSVCIELFNCLKSELKSLTSDQLDSVSVSLPEIEVSATLETDMFDLIDAICLKNKMIHDTFSSLKQSLIESVQSSIIKKVPLTSDSVEPVLPSRSNQDISLLMSVVDQTVVNHTVINESNDFINYTDTNDSCQSIEPVVPERTLWILPGSHDTSDAHLEKSIFLHGYRRKSVCSMVDPLRSDNDVTTSNFASDTLRFSKYPHGYLDESGNEFHDAQDSVVENDPLTMTINPSLVSEDVYVKNLSAELKTMMGIDSSSEEDILNEVQSMISAVESVKTLVGINHPDMDCNDLESIYSQLCSKISFLKLNHSLFREFLDNALKSIKDFKRIKQSISSDLIENQKDFLYNNALLTDALSRYQDIISTLEKEHETLKNAYNDCLQRLNVMTKDKSDADDQYKELSLKYDDLIKVNSELNQQTIVLQTEYKDIKATVKDLKNTTETKTSEAITLNNEISILKVKSTSYEKMVSDNENKIQTLNSEKASLLAEIESLKQQLTSTNVSECVNDLKLDFDKQNAKLISVESLYNDLLVKHEDLLNQYLESKMRLETLTKDSSKKTVSYFVDVIKEIKQILKALDLNDQVELEDDITELFSKMVRRIDLLKEHRNVLNASSSVSQISDLNKKIRILENDIQDANDFKYNFSKELHSLKPDHLVSDLLKRPLAELHTLMITEIMARENVIISNLKDDCNKQISSLKEEIRQLEEKDKRRIDWVTEVENDNEHLNTESKRLKREVQCATEMLDVKLSCEKLIMKTLLAFERKLNDQSSEQDNSYQDDEKNSDIISRSEVSGEILVKLQKILKSYSPVEESPELTLYRCKDQIKSLEVTRDNLQNKLTDIEQKYLDVLREQNIMKETLACKTELYAKEKEHSETKVFQLEKALADLKHHLEFSENSLKREQENLAREKEFSLKILEESENCKSQLERHISHLSLVNKELNDAKEVVKTTMAKHQEEILSLMSVISGLESDLKLARSTVEERILVESQLEEQNKLLSQVQQEYETRVSDLEIENKSLKNDINLKQKEITILMEGHKQEITKLKSSVTDDLAYVSSLKLAQDNFIKRISQLETELYEKESFYMNRVSDLMIEREEHLNEITCLKESVDQNKKIFSDLESKIIEYDNKLSNLKKEYHHKVADLSNQLLSVNQENERLNSRNQLIENKLTEKDIFHSNQVKELNEIINQHIREIDRIKATDKGSGESDSFCCELIKLFPEFSGCSPELVSHIKGKICEIDTLKEELEEKKTAYRYLDEECDDMVAMNKHLDQCLEKSAKEKTDLENNIKKMEKTVEKLEQQLSLKCGELEKLVKEREVGSDAVAGLEQRLLQMNSNLSRLTQENLDLNNKLLQKPTECPECKKLSDNLLQYKSKLKAKELKLLELNSKIDAFAQPSKENASVVDKQRDKIKELEYEISKLKSRGEHSATSPLKDKNGQHTEDQSSKMSKLEARIVKLEKDREFMKTICDKRLAKIQDLKIQLESKK